MRILMFGRGVISTIYGWALANAGHEVNYFVRPQRVLEYGTSVEIEIFDSRQKGAEGKISEHVPTELIDTLDDNHNYDLIIVSVSHASINEVVKYLSPRLGRASILMFNNFWLEPEQACAALPAEQIIWGFPQAGGGFPNGKLRGLLVANVIFGSFNKSLNEREVKVRELFEQAGFKISEQQDIRGWLFAHFIVNGGMHTEQILAGGIVELFNSGEHRRNVILNSRELLPLLVARGVDLKLHKSEVMLMKLPAWVGGMMLGLAWRFYKPLKLMAESHSNPEDMLSTCEALLDYAKAQNIPTPRLEMAVKTATQYND